MSRQQRRAAERQAKHAKLDPAVAFHEAGHAVAKYIGAPEMGRDPGEAIAWIDVFNVQHSQQSMDKSHELHFQARTMGPMFSKDIQKIVTAEIRPGTGINHRVLLDLFDRLRSERRAPNFEPWLSARNLDAVFGAMAEAAFTGC